MGFKKKIIQGASWQLFSQVSVQILSIGVTAVLARLLNPEDYGLVALSGVFVGFAWIFANIGMGEAIIQRQNINDEYLSTSFWTSIFTGTCIALALVVMSPFISMFYDKDILKFIIMVVSLNFLISPFTATHTTILTKNLEFKKIAFISVIRKVIAGSVSISLALAGWGVWSLVLGSLTADIFMIPAVWYLVRWRPKFIFVKKCFKDLFGFGSNIMAFNFFNYFARNFDNLIIGKFLGAVSLGYYSMAYELMMKPLTYVSWSVGRVLFPAFSSMQNDKERVRSAYLKVVRSISIITFPMMLGLMTVAREFVLTYYGAKWEPVILPLQLLCVVGALQSIGTNVGTIFLSQGRADLQLKIGVFNSSVVVIAFLIGIQWGLIGLIVGYMIGWFPLFFSTQYFANRLISLNLWSFLKALLPATVCSLLMVAFLLVFKYLNEFFLHLNIFLTLFASIALGTFLYSFFLFIFFNKTPEIQEAKLYIKTKLFNRIKYRPVKSELL